MYTQEEKDDQALALLEAAAQPELRGHLRRYALRLTNLDDDAADELLQQALLNAHDAVQRRGWSGHDPRLYLVQAIKWYHFHERTRGANVYSLEPARTTDEDDAASGWGLAAEPEAADLAPLAGRIDAALHQLPEAERAAFLLHVEGHSTRQIGELIGTPHRTVARIINRTKEALAARFQSAYDLLLS